MSSYRVEKMASNIRTIVSDVILNDLNDPRISRFTSVTRVEVSGDLQIAKIFVSVLGADSEGRKTFAALEHASGRIQRTLARRLRARFCPEIRLYLDESLKRAAETIAMIERTAAESSSAGHTGYAGDSDEERRGGAAE